MTTVIFKNGRFVADGQGTSLSVHAKTGEHGVGTALNCAQKLFGVAGQYNAGFAGRLYGIYEFLNWFNQLIDSKYDLDHAFRSPNLFERACKKTGMVSKFTPRYDVNAIVHVIETNRVVGFETVEWPSLWNGKEKHYIKTFEYDLLTYNVAMAIGTGTKYALEKLNAGSSQLEALKYAMKHDKYSGGTIATLGEMVSCQFTLDFEGELE